MASESGRGVGLLLARLCLAAVFLYTGITEIQETGEIAGMLAAHGYPIPVVMAWGAAIAEIAGGVSLALGLLTPLGCLALILFLLPTTYTFHLPGLLKGDPGQTVDTLKNLGLVGGLIALMFSGPGRFSIDAKIMKGDKG